MSASAPEPVASSTPQPTVLAVVVVTDGAAAWIGTCLRALAHQSYPRLGVLAIDDATTDGAAELLDRALGGRRVLRNERALGFAGSIRAALERPVASGADFVLIVDPRAAPDREAGRRLVEAAVGNGGERVANGGAEVVGPGRPHPLP